MEKYIEHFQTWQKVWSIKSIQHISVFAYVYVLVLLGGESKNHGLPRGGGGACYVLNHPSSKEITCQGRDPIRRVVRLYNWANPASQWFAVFGTRKLDKNQGVTGAGQGIAQDFIWNFGKLGWLIGFHLYDELGKIYQTCPFFEGWETWNEGVFERLKPIVVGVMWDERGIYF